MPQTATMIDPLGDFMHGYSISDGTRHVIVFTDKDQDDAPVEASAEVTAREVTNIATTTDTITKLGTKSGNMYTGVEYTPANEPALTGTLTCPSGASCSVDATTAADGTVTINLISGYVFTGSRAAKAEVTAMNADAQATANSSYLAFGVWLNQDSNNDGTDDDPAFGAFAAGGSTAEVAAAVTGTATYNGSATGVYTAGSSVDYFQGDATLEADFGDDAALGTITGMIDSIVAGGNDMDDVIYLNDDGTPVDGNITALGAFAGDARMGFKETVDAVTTYHHNGSWSGQFYNGTANDPDTDADESLVAPGSVAGTFGVTGETGTGDDAVTRSYVGAFGAHKD
jgi:hypothetical protein